MGKYLTVSVFCNCLHVMSWFIVLNQAHLTMPVSQAGNDAHVPWRERWSSEVWEGHHL